LGWHVIKPKADWKTNKGPNGINKRPRVKGRGKGKKRRRGGSHKRAAYEPGGKQEGGNRNLLKRVRAKTYKSEGKKVE